MYGDGSDGPLNVASGTTNLALDTKHQFTTVSVASGAVLSTTDTVGSVLYICATDSITIDGDIDLRGKVSRGQNSWSITIDSRTYSSPSSAAGGSGGNALSSGNGGVQGNGFGGGGAGGGIQGDGFPTLRGGHGGAGGAPGGSGGAGVTLGASGSSVGNNGGTSSGGGGAIFSFVGSRTSGAGGAAYGNTGTSGPNTADHAQGGGGGAGGQAGTPGIHVVLLAPSVTINGSIFTSGTNGLNGGNGANGYVGNDIASTFRGSGGGGGGAGNGGSVYVFTKRNGFEDNGTYDMLGGLAGLPGTGYQSGGYGGAGTHGALNHTEIMPRAIPVRVYDGSAWVFAIAHSRVSGQWQRSAVRERG